LQSHGNYNHYNCTIAQYTDLLTHSYDKMRLINNIIRKSVYVWICDIIYKRRKNLWLL